MSILFIIVCSLAYHCMKNKKQGILTGALHLSLQESEKLNDIKTIIYRNEGFIERQASRHFTCINMTTKAGTVCSMYLAEGNQDTAAVLYTMVKMDAVVNESFTIKLDSLEF